jgi:hypothetical protein
LTSIIIPPSVSSIENNTFSYCTGLTNIIFTSPSSVKIIGQKAFYGSGLTKITIPSSVKSIKSYAFQYCNNLTSSNIENCATTKYNDDTYFADYSYDNEASFDNTTQIICSTQKDTTISLQELIYIIYLIIFYSIIVVASCAGVVFIYVSYKLTVKCFVSKKDDNNGSASQPDDI